MKKNNLFKELNVEEPKNTSYTALDIDVRDIKRRVNEKIVSASEERKSEIMKSKKKLSIIAAAAVLTVGVTAFAASTVVKTRYSSSLAIPNYKSVPTQAMVVKDIGYAVVLFDRFENGYSFKDGNVEKNNFSDENGKSIEKFKSVSFRYEKDGDIVYLSQGKYNSETETEGNVIATQSGTDIYYYSYTNKFVPADYEFTEEDKKAEENGEMVFSTGSSEVEIANIRSVTWEKDGIKYCLMQMDGKLTPDELSAMAKEIINK